MSHEKNIFRELSKTLFSLVNAGTIPVAKYYVLVLIAFQILMTLKLLLNSRANLITKTNSLSLVLKSVNPDLQLGRAHLPSVTV